MIFRIFLLSLCLISNVAFKKILSTNRNIFNKLSNRGQILHNSLEKDDQGYIIKSREWFEGLSKNLGGTITDPRSIPAECKEFTDKVKKNEIKLSFQDTIDIIDKYYYYFECGFTCGDVTSKAGENIGSSKIFSFAYLNKLNEEETLRLFGEYYRELIPNGVDHPNIRNFLKYGWKGVVFHNGLSILAKQQGYDDTDSAFSTQSFIEGESNWSQDSDSWIP